MSNGETPSFDIGSLLEALKNAILPVGGTAVVAGYPACRLMFGERKWRKCLKEEKAIFSVGVGGGLAVLFWIAVTLAKLTNSQYRSVIEGNEAYLTVALLFLAALIEVILIAVITVLQRTSNKRKKS